MNVGFRNNACDAASQCPEHGQTLCVALKASSSPLPTRIVFLGNYLPPECDIHVSIDMYIGTLNHIIEDSFVLP